MDSELNQYENFKDKDVDEEENKSEKNCENSDNEYNEKKSLKNENDELEEMRIHEDIKIDEENGEENIEEVSNKSDSNKEKLQMEISEHSQSPEKRNSHHSSLKEDMELEDEMPNISIKDGQLDFYRPTMIEASPIYYSEKPSNRTKPRRRKMEKSRIKRSINHNAIALNDIWIPVTPQMLLHTLKRLRFLKLGPNKHEIISNLRLHYPVRTKFNDLARELRHKLRCAVQRGFIHQNGGHYKLNYRETRGNRLQKKQIKDFWSHYQELRPISEPREPSPPSDYEPFAEPN